MCDLKFVYLKDPIDDRRVLTIGYEVLLNQAPSGTDKIRYHYSINKLVDKEAYTIDGRLKEFLGPTCFKEVQKRFKKRYGGDQHNKKIAKAIICGGFECYYAKKIEYHKDVHPVHFILWNLSGRALRNEHVSRIAEYYYRKRIVENVTDEVKSNISGGWTSVGEKI